MTKLNHRLRGNKIITLNNTAVFDIFVVRLQNTINTFLAFQKVKIIRDEKNPAKMTVADTVF